MTQPSHGPSAADAEVLNSAEKRMQRAALNNKRSLGAMTVRNLSLNDAWHEEERRRGSGGPSDAESTPPRSPSPNPTRAIWMEIRRVTQPSLRLLAAEAPVLDSPERRLRQTALRNKRSLGAMTLRSETVNDAWFEVERWFSSQTFNE